MIHAISTHMAYINIVVPLIFLSLVTHSSSWGSRNDSRYVQDACSVTQYTDLCIHSLSPFSNTAKQDPSKWARAGVSVTISEAKCIMQYLMKLQNRTSIVGRNKISLSDCVQCIDDALDSLRKSLDVLRELSSATFDSQVGDVTTWVSAALTDEGTCLDGFDEGGSAKGRWICLLQNRVTNASHITSNALALVNKLAITGPV